MTFLIGLLGLRRQRQTSSRDDKQPTAKQRAEKNIIFYLKSLHSSLFSAIVSFSLFWYSIFISRICHSSIFHRERGATYDDSRQTVFHHSIFFLLLPLPSISNVVFPPLICCVRFELISTVSFFLLLLHSFRHSWHFRRQSCITHTRRRRALGNQFQFHQNQTTQRQKSPFRMTRIGN